MKSFFIAILILLYAAGAQAYERETFSIKDGSGVTGYELFSGKESVAYILIPDDYKEGNKEVGVLIPGLGGTKEQMWGHSLTLAREGYITIAVTPPGISLDGVNLIEYAVNLFRWNLELIWAINYITTQSVLSPYVNPNKVFIVGHSWGGMTAAIASCADPRIKVIVLLSPASLLSSLSDIKVPTIIITGWLDFQQKAANEKLFPGLECQKMIVNLTMGAKHGCFIGKQGCEPWVPKSTAHFYLAFLDYFLHDNEDALDTLYLGSPYLDPNTPSYLNLFGKDEEIYPTFTAE